MKKLALSLIALLSVCGLATAQSRTMTVHQKDGTTQVFKVANVDKVTFEDATPVELNNQYAINDDVHAIALVTEQSDGENYTFSLYSSADATDADVQITLPASSLGDDIDLAGGTATVKAKSLQFSSLKGTLNVAFDKFKKNVTIALESTTESGDALRAAYSGAFTVTYAAANQFTVTPQGGEAVTASIPSMLRIKPASTGAATNFAFGDVAASTAADLLTAKNAVWFSVAASKLNGTVDLAADASSYTFRYIDYATGTVYDKAVSGTITTASADGDKAYVKLSAVLENGTTVTAEYYGPVTDVESLDEMIPTPVLPNQYTYYNADGVQTNQQTIASVKYSTTSEGWTVLYFVPDGASVTDTYTTPQLQFADKLVNAGNIDLSKLADGDGFSIKFASIQLMSPDAKYYGYGNVPNNGTLNIKKDADGNYDVYLEVVNSYPSTWGSGTSGDNTKLVISYKGAVEPK